MERGCLSGSAQRDRVYALLPLRERQIPARQHAERHGTARLGPAGRSAAPGGRLLSARLARCHPQGGRGATRPGRCRRSLGVGSAARAEGAGTGAPQGPALKSVRGENEHGEGSAPEAHNDSPPPRRAPLRCRRQPPGADRTGPPPATGPPRPLPASPPPALTPSQGLVVAKEADAGLLGAHGAPQSMARPAGGAPRSPGCAASASGAQGGGGRGGPRRPGGGGGRASSLPPPPWRVT